ncbi:hypothetical protein ARTSIC4J27_859 [Pseudarthrobacter siccitolerans]|uniref:Uncharacterized protein n=1 Tax=Pseudarthrobacter siccitolerans TaxID=861266 RepID=A0A024GYU8_9MICC|nr:hypothetical protein ARTSIC4J27_859 [Pseudarthrobacter siccitolerans]
MGPSLAGAQQLQAAEEARGSGVRFSMVSMSVSIPWRRINGAGVERL